MSMDDADRRLASWLESAAPSAEPEHLLASVLEVTARTSRRPAWRIPERWLSMTSISTTLVGGRGMRWPVAVAVVLLLLVLLAGVALVGGSRPRVPAPFGVAGNGLIAYEAAGDIFAVDAAGRSRLLAGEAGLDIAPEFSRDGSLVAYLHAADPADSDPHRFELRVAAADGSGARALGEYADPDPVAWSPTGDRIAITSATGGDRRGIVIVDVAAGTRTALDPGIEAEQPVFRPDGKQLLFRGRPAGGAWGLYLVNADGTGLVHLSLDVGFENDRYYATNLAWYFLVPAWSPDGSSIAYHTLEDSTVDPDPGFRIHVARVAADGTVSEERVLAPDPAIDDQGDAAWLPDGSGLLADQVEEGVPALVRWTLAPTLVVREIGADAGLQRAGLDGFVLSPDGTRVLAWSKDRALLVPTDGSPATPVAAPVGGWASWQRVAP